jgi:bifunctional non-homologous end joining protein LigD
VRPELVAKITYMTRSDDWLLRHTVFVGLREDKPAKQVRRE